MPLLGHHHHHQNSRDSTVLPTMKCAQCNQDVHIRLIGQHECSAAPPLPKNLQQKSPPPAGVSRGLSSFFGGTRDTVIDTYKPSLQMLADDDQNEDFDFDTMLQNAATFKTNTHPGYQDESRRPNKSRQPLPPLSGASGSSVDGLSASITPLAIAKGSPDSSSSSRLEKAREELITSISNSNSPVNQQQQVGSISETNNKSNNEVKATETTSAINKPPNMGGLHARPLNNGHKKKGSIAISGFSKSTEDQPNGGRTVNEQLARLDTTIRLSPRKPSSSTTTPISDHSYTAPASYRSSPSSAPISSKHPPPPCLSATPSASSITSATSAPNNNTMLPVLSPQRKVSPLASKKEESPLDLLASLVAPPSQTKPKAIVKQPVPRVETKCRNSGGMMGRSLKSAKLDSLLDDLMGEMLALSTDVRNGSDRESTASTASTPQQTNDLTQAMRDRFDSTSSTSSTLSGGTTTRRAHQPNKPICRGCNEPCEITTKLKTTVYALDSWWHRGCFHCQECRAPFPDKSFYVFDQLPYCRYDYHRLNKSLCGGCQEPIEGACAQVPEGRFHPECFACDHCKEPLTEIYFSLEGRFLCEKHVHKQKSFRSANKRRTVFGHI